VIAEIDHALIERAVAADGALIEAPQY